MITLINKNGLNYLVNNDRVFLLSQNVNIFPCARRGLYNNSLLAEYYDPEARLNTERTNRISTAINGFTNSFIITEDFVDTNTFAFVLAGYRIEIKNFNISDIASLLSTGTTPADKVYAHLSLHTNIELDVAGYFTEILYRQSTAAKQTNYLDVTYENSGTIKDDFFVGISFTKEPVEDYVGSDTLPSHNLLLFSKGADDSWQIAQTSLLPKIEHGEYKDSIKVSGNIKSYTMSATGKITTPKVNVAVITSDYDVIDVHKGLSVAGDIAVHSTLTVTNSTKSAKADIDILEADSATINGATTVNDTLTAKKVVIPSNKDADGVEKGEIVTPQVRVNRITSNEGSITVDNKKLIVNKSLEMLAKADATEPAKATIEQAVIGDLTVKVDANLKNSTGKVTAKEVAAEKITQNGNPVPSITIVPVDDAYQLQFTLNASKN